MSRQISLKRQAQLRADEPVVRRLYAEACQRFGQEEVDKDLTRIWDLRCILGMQGRLPFSGGTIFKDLGEMLWLAREVCGLGQKKATA
jgi:hypothetical protein